MIILIGCIRSTVGYILSSLPIDFEGFGNDAKRFASKSLVFERLAKLGVGEEFILFELEDDVERTDFILVGSFNINALNSVLNNVCIRKGNGLVQVGEGRKSARPEAGNLLYDLSAAPVDGLQLLPLEFL